MADDGFFSSMPTGITFGDASAGLNLYGDGAGSGVFSGPTGINFGSVNLTGDNGFLETLGSLRDEALKTYVGWKQLDMATEATPAQMVTVPGTGGFQMDEQTLLIGLAILAAILFLM